MLPSNRIPIHPGVILKTEYCDLLGITQVELANHIGVPVQRINEIVNGKRGITPQTAWLLADALETSPEFWLNLQTNHDLVLKRPNRTVKPMKKDIA